MPASAKPRKQRAKSRRVTLNKTRKKARIFAPIRRLMASLRKGEIDTIQGVPAFIDWEGEWRQVVPTLKFWRNFWVRVSENQHLGIDFAAEDRIIRELDYGIPMMPEIIEAADAALRACEEAFMKTPLNVMSDMILTEQIALEWSFAMESAAGVDMPARAA